VPRHPGPVSADVDPKSVGHADVADTLKPTLLLFYLDTILFVSLPRWEASVTDLNRHSNKIEYNTIDICSISQATSSIFIQDVHTSSSINVKH
jgi:hypothetical protein